MLSRSFPIAVIAVIAVIAAALLLGACSTEKPVDTTATQKPVETTQTGKVKQQKPVPEPESKRQSPAKAEGVIAEQDSAMPASTAPMVARSRAAKALMANESMAYTGGVPSRIRMPSEPLDRENYKHYKANPVKLVSEEPVSTFSIDVDTGSYANIRRMLGAGRLPPQDAVRIEEMINYFSYNYRTPDNLKRPFAVTTEIAPAPWDKGKHLLHIGIKGYEVDRASLPASNLVFLVDVSGSMRSPNKIGLLKSALKMLSRQLSSKDRISLVVYAGASGVVLEPTPGNQHGKIAAALDALQAGGSTNGGAGIRLAYAMAEQAFIKGGVNRVILATDGDFNVGTVNFEALTDLVEEKRKSGIALTTLGFGSGNYNDHLMEQLADKGNGNYAYIDTINEARKVLVDEMGATLLTIAKDVKIQIEFNPTVVSEYRLIGYENRMLNREDFNNDQVDAGEIGAGHTVTAIYELVLKGNAGRIDPLRYGDGSDRVSERSFSNSEVAFLRLRYKKPDQDTSRLLEYPLKRTMVKHSAAKASDMFRFSASVAAFGDLLRGGKYSNGYKYSELIALAQSARGKDAFGLRGEFVNLVRTASALSSKRAAPGE